MKFTITFKDPDGVYESVKDASAGFVPAGLSDAEHDDAVELRRDQLSEAIKPWVAHGEYITVEFDLSANPPSARVLGGAR